MIEIFSGSHDLHKLRVCVPGRKTIFGRQVAGDKGAEVLSTSQVVGAVHLLRLSQEWIVAHGVAGLSMAVIATANGIYKITAESHQSIVLASEVERDRSDLIAAPNALPVSSFVSIVIIIGVDRDFQSGDCGEHAKAEGTNHQRPFHVSLLQVRLHLVKRQPLMLRVDGEPGRFTDRTATDAIAASAFQIANWDAGISVCAAQLVFDGTKKSRVSPKDPRLGELRRGGPRRPSACCCLERQHDLAEVLTLQQKPVSISRRGERKLGADRGVNLAAENVGHHRVQCLPDKAVVHR